jgi:integrase
LKTRSFEKAQQLVRDLEDGIQPRKTPRTVTLKNALDSFIVDCESRNLNQSTLRKYRSLRDNLNTHFTDPYHLSECAIECLREFRQQRKLGPRTAAKELERIRAFFRFCVENGWLQANPAKAIKAPQAKVLPRLPFSEKEIQKITAKAIDDRELAFILTLRHTGLRIGDASLLRQSHLTEDRLYLYTTKAGTPVSIVIPDQLVSLLRAIPPRGGYFFLRGGSTSMHTTADLWRRRIKILCKAAKVAPDHPHRFRHSLAADLLAKGASVEDVAAILGNSPAIVAKHYSQWIKSRQDRLDAIIQATWKRSLVRVK